MRLIFFSLCLVAFTACDSKKTKEDTPKENETSAVAVSEIFKDPNVARFAVDRAYRAASLEKGKTYVELKDNVMRKAHRVEMTGMEEVYPVGLQTAFVGVQMTSTSVNRKTQVKDTLLVDYKVGWNSQINDPKYNRKGTFQVLDYQIRAIGNKARYRWLKDGEYWKQELITSDEAK
ncbi:MAG: hypothetical protein AAF740_14120 [Bacteroidota bacterium]